MTISVELPLAKNGITVSKSPLTNSNPPISKTSTTLTLVALEGPLLVTVIVKVITSPIVASSLSVTLTTVKLTTGITFKSTESLTTVSFSLHVTFTTFVKVPFTMAFNVIVNTYDSPAPMTGMFNTPVALL